MCELILLRNVERGYCQFIVCLFSYNLRLEQELFRYVLVQNNQICDVLSRRFESCVVKIKTNAAADMLLASWFSFVFLRYGFPSFVLLRPCTLKLKYLWFVSSSICHPKVPAISLHSRDFFVRVLFLLTTQVVFKHFEPLHSASVYLNDTK